MPDIVERTKRPVRVRTRLWTGTNVEEMREFCGECFRLPLRRPKDQRITAEVYDRLHSTWIGVYTGHHVVHGVKGEFYPIDESVLEETYEPPDPADVVLADSEREGAQARQEAADALMRLDEEIGCADLPTLSQACFGNRCSECAGCFECPCHGENQRDPSCSGPAAQTVPNNQEQ